MKNHKQDDDDYQPAKKTKAKPGPNSGPKTAPKAALPKPKPRQRVRTRSLDPVGASAQILIPTPKQLKRPAKKITPHIPQHFTNPKDDFNWDIDNVSDGAAGPAFTTKRKVKTGKNKPALKKPRFGPLELDSDVIVMNETPKRNTLVSKMTQAAKKTTASPEKSVTSVKKPIPRRQEKENKENELVLVQDAHPMNQTNVGDLDAELAPQRTTTVKRRASNRDRQTDNKENEEVVVIEDSSPTEPKLKQNLGTKLTQALADCELLSEAPVPPTKKLTQRLGLQQQVQSPATASVNSLALLEQFDPSMVDEHANRKPNLVGWNMKGPTNQGVSPKKKLPRVPSATVNEQGSPIVGSVDPRLHLLPRELLDLNQLPDTSEFTSDHIGQSNDNDEVVAEPTQAIIPGVLDRSDSRKRSESLSFSEKNRSIPSTIAPAKLPESSTYANENFHQSYDADADSVFSEDAVDLIPTQLAIPTQVAIPMQVETISKPRHVPIVASTVEIIPQLPPNRPTLKPILESAESSQPLTRANLETLKSIAQIALTSPDIAVPVKTAENVLQKTARIVTNVAVQKKPVRPLPQDPLKRRIAWQEAIPSKKVRGSHNESMKRPIKPVLQQKPAREQNVSENVLGSQAIPLPKVQRMQPTEYRPQEQIESQNGVGSQVKSLSKGQRVKYTQPTSHDHTVSEDETRNSPPAKNFRAANKEPPPSKAQSRSSERRAPNNRSVPKTFEDRLKQRFASPAPPLPRSPPRLAIQTQVSQRQKLTRRPASSPHRYATESRRVQDPTTPPLQYTIERDMDVTLVESDSGVDEEFEEYVESVEEEQYAEYLSSDSAVEAEEGVDYKYRATTPDHAPSLPEHQRAVNEALHKLADAITIRFCDKETAINVPIGQFERGAQKVVSIIAEGRTDDLKDLNTRLDKDREKVSARIEQMIGGIEAHQSPPARKNSKRVIEERLKNTLSSLDGWMERAGVQREDAA